MTDLGLVSGHGGRIDAMARACHSDEAHLYASTCAAHFETKAPPEPETAVLLTALEPTIFTKGGPSA